MQMAEKHGLSEPDTYQTLITAIGDVVLGLQSTDEMKAQLGEWLTPELEKDIATFLTAEPGDLDNSKADTEFDLANEIAETEAALEKIPAVRTMESDKTQHNQATTEAVHTAAGQDELLTRDQEVPTAAPQPTAAPPEPAPSNADVAAAKTPTTAKNETDGVPLQGAPGQGPRWESEHKDT